MSKALTLSTLFDLNENTLFQLLISKTNPTTQSEIVEIALVLVEALTRRDTSSNKPKVTARRARDYIESDAFKNDPNKKEAVSTAFIAKYRSPVPPLTLQNRISAAHLVAARIQETLIEEATQLLTTCPPHHPMQDFVIDGLEGFEHLTGRVQTAWVKAAETLAQPNASDALKMALTLIIEKSLESQDLDVQQTAASALPKAITGLGNFSGLLVPSFSKALVAKDVAVRNIARAAALEIIPVAPALFLKALREELCEMKLSLPDIQTPLNKRIKAMKDAPPPSQAFPSRGSVDGPTTRRAPIGKKLALGL